MLYQVKITDKVAPGQSAVQMKTLRGRVVTFVRKPVQPKDPKAPKRESTLETILELNDREALSISRAGYDIKEYKSKPAKTTKDNADAKSGD